MKLRLTCIATVIALAVACGGGDSGPTGSTDNGDIVGTYVMKSVNGSTLPGVYHLDASTRLMLDTATLRLSANGAYSDNRTTTLFDLTGEHKNTDAKTGTWAFASGVVTLSFNSDIGVPTTAALSVSGKTLTTTEGSVVLVWSKQ